MPARVIYHLEESVAITKIVSSIAQVKRLDDDDDASGSLLAFSQFAIVLPMHDDDTPGGFLGQYISL